MKKLLVGIVIGIVAITLSGCCSCGCHGLKTWRIELINGEHVWINKSDIIKSAKNCEQIGDGKWFNEKYFIELRSGQKYQITKRSWCNLYPFTSFMGYESFMLPH